MPKLTGWNVDYFKEGIFIFVAEIIYDATKKRTPSTPSDWNKIFITVLESIFFRGYLVVVEIVLRNFNFLLK